MDTKVEAGARVYTKGDRENSLPRGGYRLAILGFALVAIGVIQLLVYGIGASPTVYGPSGFQLGGSSCLVTTYPSSSSLPSLPSCELPVSSVAFGILVVGAAVFSVASLKNPRTKNRLALPAVVLVVLGVILVVSSRYIAFPVGCNVTPSCTPDPVGFWSTNWLNVLILDFGIVLVGWGLGMWWSGRLLSVPLGIALILAGIVLLAGGLTVSYAMSCLSSGLGYGGCTGPTTFSSEWFVIFWPDVIAGSFGIILIAVGAVVVLLARRRSRLPLRT